jgi:hypothetical protein
MNLPKVTSLDAAQRVQLQLERLGKAAVGELALRLL